MNPIYKFTLALNSGAENRVFPLYGSDLAKEYELQTNEQFYRAKLSGKLTFEATDYNTIANAVFDTKFTLKLYISYNAGGNWSLYWTGQFWKTDCEFDIDNKRITVIPTVVDKYTDVLAGLEKEFNLIDLTPAMVPVKLDKRPMIQVYVPGQTVIGCFLSGMWWEQECESVLETDTVHIGDEDVNKLRTYLHFYKNKTLRLVEASGETSPSLPEYWTALNPTNLTFTATSSGYIFRCRYDESDPEYVKTIWEIIGPNNVTMWRLTVDGEQPATPAYQVTLYPVGGTGASGNVVAYIHDIPVYARIISDSVGSGATQTYPLPLDDMVPNNRNYTRCLGYNDPDTIFFSTNLTQTPTPWGLYQPGQYYDQPSGSWYFGEFHPISRSAWGRVSIWFNFTDFSLYSETLFRQEYTLNDAYSLASAISVLLAQIAPGITHYENTNYSQFLYGNNPLTGLTQKILLSPKSNMASAGYDQPAQKAPITLKYILDMLRDCFRCYWFIDDQNRFRIEHIYYFMNGGNYSASQNIGRDLTTESVSRNGKKWAFDTSKYQYDKPAMAARYQFGWMDDVTQLFEGFPIDIVSQYVNPDNIEEISVQQFSSDVDYIMLNPSEISKDGFVLLSAVVSSGSYKLPYLTVEINGTEFTIQNAYVSFYFLQRYYVYDMPAANYKINGTAYTAQGTKKLKIQTLKFPCLTDPNMMQLIKTNLGNGTIQKLSVNLSSRNANATLKYDT